MAKKHNFHCGKCNSECMIYKKGKKHRVLVCPKCGVLATNPFSAGGALGGAATGAALGSVVPGIGTGIGAIGGGLIGGFLSDSGENTATTNSSGPSQVTCPERSYHTYTTQQRVYDALGRY